MIFFRWACIGIGQNSKTICRMMYNIILQSVLQLNVTITLQNCKININRECKIKFLIYGWSLHSFLASSHLSLTDKAYKLSALINTRTDLLGLQYTSSNFCNTLCCSELHRPTSRYVILPWSWSSEELWVITPIQSLKVKQGAEAATAGWLISIQKFLIFVRLKSINSWHFRDSDKV